MIHCWVVLALWITGIFVLIANASWLKYLSYHRFLHKVRGIMSTALPVAGLKTPLQVMHCNEMALSFFVASTSGLAVLSMPTLAPVVDFADVSRTLLS
ncbi:hypothetical protein P775_22085 [Puniceibacterium antarcticum]|uniref:Uncharacterized protein n=1 Tax=Puniceibacterium antarcticum TaxID=1206336 RepID=A0A2G8R959_9RHOB|nr:hypothetical protein [Puniceibacterium antarcticum]PIL17981.1 hypothetical protein P775_22085 [Puniceibacterium antarcticum]